MNNNSFIRLDLLKKRRKGIELEDVLFSSNKGILRKGIAIGSSFLIISILICLGTFIQTQIYKKEILELKEYTLFHDNLKSQINAGLAEIRSTKRFNQNIANSIMGLRSISEIIYELGTLVPLQSKLDSIQINKNKLNINGNSESALNLDIINTFILGLKNSPFIIKDTVTLLNAKSKVSRSTQISQDTELKFNIKADLISEYINLNKTRINKIKSPGLDYRIQIIKEEGLIK